MKRKGIIALLVVLSILIIPPLLFRLRFDSTDLAIVNIYKSGDTLVFRNVDSSDTVSFRITKKEIQFKGLTEAWYGNPEECTIYYQTIPPDQVTRNEHLFLTFVKWEPDSLASIHMQFGGFLGYIHESHGNLDYFEITHSCIECKGVDSSDVVKIRWKRYEGLIWYQKKDSTKWELLRKL